MAPLKRRKTSAVAEPSSGNTNSGVRTRRSAGARGDLHDAPDADLDGEPELLMCPITRAVFRDPVMVVDSGHTYERSAILSHFERNGAKDPLTRRALSSTKVMTNWALRNLVQDWVDKHPGVTPDGWDSRELLEPSKDDGTFDDEGVLRTWRAMCPELQGRWSEHEQPEDWEGVFMENGRVVELSLEDFGLTGAVPAEIGRLSALGVLNLDDNQLTSVPAEIGQLTALEELNLKNNQLTSLPAEIGQLTLLTELYLDGNQLTSLPAEIGQLTAMRVLHLSDNQLTSLPAEIGRLSALRQLYLFDNRLTSLPAEIGQLASLLGLFLNRNQLTSVPAEIGQLTSLRELYLANNRLTSVPAEIGQLTSLTMLNLRANLLTSVPAEIGQLTSLIKLSLYGNQLTSVPAAIRELDAGGCNVYLDDGVRVDVTRTFDDEGDVGVLRTWRAMCPELQEWWPEDEQPEDWEGVEMGNGRVVELVLEDFGLTGAVPAEIGRLSALRELNLGLNQLTSLPAEIGQLTSLREFNVGDNQLKSVPAEIGQLAALEELDLGRNQLTSLPAEIGQLTSLTLLFLGGNRLTRLPAAIRELTAAGCHVRTDAGVRVEG